MAGHEREKETESRKPVGREGEREEADLVCAADEVQVMLVEELRDCVLAKGEGDPAVVVPPALDVLVRVSPEEVAEEPGVGDVCGPSDLFYLLQRAELRRQAPVHAQDLLVDERGHREAVETLGECLPEADVVPALALVVEAVDAVDGRALVVPPQQEEVFWVLYLVRQQQTDRLQALLASVDVVPQEQVVGLRGEAPVLEQPQQVRVLPMDVPCTPSHDNASLCT